MRTALVLALLTAAPSQIQLERQQIRPTRVMRVLRDGERGGVGAPFYQFAPSNGSGMTAECAGTAITSATGGTLTVTRASSLDCRKGGFTKITGISPGDVVTVSSNLPRVSYLPGTTTLGLEVWGSFTQSIGPTDDLTGAGWASTATVVTNNTTDPLNTSTADKVTDSSGAAQQCSNFTFATTSLTRHQVSAYVKGSAGMAKAQLKLVGTGNAAGDCTHTVTDLSSSTYHRMWCTSSAAYAAGLTAVTISICVGDAAADQGDIFAWRVNHLVAAEQVSFPYPSVGSATAVPVEAPVATVPAGLSTSDASFALSFAPAWASAGASTTMNAALLFFDGNGRPMYGPGAAPTAVRIFDGTNDVSNTHAWTAGTVYRLWASYAGTTAQISDGVDTTTGSFDGTFGAAALTSLQIGRNSGVGSTSFGTVALVRLCNGAARCR